MSETGCITDADVPADTIVFFDFDGTLSTRDSLLPFLYFTLGTSGLLWTCLRASPWLVGYGLRLISNNAAKERLLSIAFKGRTISSLQEQGRIFANTVLPSMLRPDMMARVAGYRKAGCCCVLVSASLDIYLQPWAGAAGMDAVLCSSLSYGVSGQVTGGFEGTNCYGEEKVRRIQAFLEKRGTGTSSTILAYGDSRGDIPMMKLANKSW
ncbi:MAG: HAD family hydrolase, partial [Acetobacter sp.]|uniref:HAD family hydrolase n=1 Tax=Acetobacter sp. TaxID=440 RepID=UPI0039EAEBA0